MTEIEKDWREHIADIATKWEAHKRDEAISITWATLSDFKTELRKAICQKEQDFTDDEIDEIESGIITGYRNCLKLIDEVLPPRE